MKQYQSESVKELATALAKAQAEIQHAKKEEDNPYFKSKYADLAAIIDAAKPALTKNGLSVVQIPDIDEQGNVVLVTQISHSSGEWIRGWYPAKPVKNDPQGLGSAVTYSRRYAYAAMTGVAAVGEDDDGNEASGRQEQTIDVKEAIFATPQHRKAFADECLDQIGKATTIEELKAVKAGNLARWNAMAASQDNADRSTWELIAPNYNEKFAAFKEDRYKPTATVESTLNAVGDKWKP